MNTAHTPDPQAFEQAKALFLQGLAHMQAGELTQAEASFVKSLVLAPARASTLANLGIVRLTLGRPADAMPALQQATALQAGDAALWLRLSQAQLALEQNAEGVASLDRALAIDPANATAWSNRGMALRALGLEDQAIASFEQALARGGDAALLNYYLAALRHEAPPASAPRSYVEHLFDDYAADFQQHLRQGLQYRAPELLVGQALAQTPAVQGKPIPWAAVLDLGCGTGLCGPLLRPHALRLEGLDISAGMLAQARALGAYDTLHHDDATEFLRQSETRWNLVMAADVFIYMGDLEPVFAAAARRLAPGGLVSFSVETPPDPLAPMVLLPSMRYAHSEAYVRQLAARHSLAVANLRAGTLREERGKPIAGLFVCLQAQP